MTSGIFSGWKDIANYLGKGVRTVQRYEGEFGLPVRRPAGKHRGSVLATKAELDEWVHGIFRERSGATRNAVPLDCGDLESAIFRLTTLLHELQKGTIQLRVSRTQLCRAIHYVCDEAVQKHNGNGDTERWIRPVHPSDLRAA
jgi:hypothetical protein